MPVDLSGSIYAQYEQARKKARDAERKGSPELAASAYRKAADLMRQYADCALDSSVKQQRLGRANALDRVAAQLDTLESGGIRAKLYTPTQSEIPSGEDDYEAQVMSLITETKIKWDDIGGLDEIKQTIKSAYGLALARKPAGVEISSWRNILLFGPPGTGKTMLAAATAGNLDATFFNVKVSSLLSKYFGESTKLVSALYSVARRMSPAVVFLDEFESLTPPRGTGDSGAERRVVSTFLAELEGLDNLKDDNFVLTMGATNLPWLLDTAILSRFQRRIYVPLPDDGARDAILEIIFRGRGLNSDVSNAELVHRTQGYSGREIERICLSAISSMINRANPELLSAVDKGQDAIRQYKLIVEPVLEEDFSRAFNEIKPGMSQKLLKDYDRWLQESDL